ncbi:branched-chain amino acid ABC transporter substrate-binding protein [Nocardia sp. CDC159]|uniref:Branched-chain amino acid ABC transporter substrate-binding protein n=1 Tax=Nocardia pulmonis TaxID=2951408 RepID=A0A9X2E3G2_9NOCA|nr:MULTISPECIES: branched-chain amino acid ABC transporter substrate-binding protein [Nocardia]MCM6773209.1 branched-chain amino acid ABC transporter substrate-binding protein [Nocardia pulmonis]MCM6786096.1 branched-chain amino acid ABC transporter substrate-binding protein [Nocardia sp. CDC159]
MARGALVIGAAAALAVAGCSSKSTNNGSGGGAAEALKITPLIQVDAQGNEVPKADTSAAADPAGDGKAKCAPNTAIAYVGALTGPNAALGININYGAKLAVDKHNKANPDCQVVLKNFDTEGDPQKASQLVPQVVQDQSIVAMIGPAFSGETKATGPIFNSAGLLALTPSATNPDLTKNGWQTFFRGLGHDGLQGPAVAKYLTKVAGYKKICVVQDNSDYGTGLAQAVIAGLGAAADPSCAVNIKANDRDFSAAVSKLSSAKPDAIFYGGYYAESAPLVQQLRSAGVKTPFVSGDGSRDLQFIKQAGDAAKDALLSCPCGPEPDDFTNDYKALNKQDPGTYSVEGYDLSTIVLKAIDSGKVTRSALVDHVRNYEGQGLARKYKWDATGELTNALIWVYQVK